MSGYALSVLPQHQKLLAASAIDPEVARARGYVSADTLKRLEGVGIVRGRRSVPGLLIPLRRADGSVWGYQYRPDTPVTPKGARSRKYETPKDQRNGIDIPAGVKDAIADPSVTLWITEGSRKADSAVTAGLCCVALTGVWNWLGKNAYDGITALADWRDIATRDRRIIVAFDSDSVVKPGVLHAQRELGRYLEGKGAKVEYLHLPHDGDGKTGLDDYIAAHGAGGLMELVRPGPPELIRDPGTPAKSAHTRTPQPDQPEQVCKPNGVCMHTPLLATIGDLLAEAVKAVHELGVTGEDRIIKGTFLTAVSQVLAEPVSLVVKGTSAGGSPTPPGPRSSCSPTRTSTR